MSVKIALKYENWYNFVNLFFEFFFIWGNCYYLLEFTIPYIYMGNVN
jgi:hypothetical protein